MSHSWIWQQSRLGGGSEREFGAVGEVMAGVPERSGETMPTPPPPPSHVSLSGPVLTKGLQVRSMKQAAPDGGVGTPCGT